MAKQIHIHIGGKAKDGVREADQLMAEVERQINRIMEKASVLEKHAGRDSGPENKKSEAQLAAIVQKLKQV